MPSKKNLLAELNRLVENNSDSLAIVFEGRDSAGKSGTIKMLTKYLPPKLFSIEHSKKPTKRAMKNWFGYWNKRLPNPGQVRFFDRSWYSRALVQRVNAWCSERQAQNFLANVIPWERQTGTRVIKFYLSISKEEQAARLNKRKKSPLTYWKFSANDKLALDSFDRMTLAKEDCIGADWIVIDFNDKKAGRLALLERLIQELKNG
jgi:polyphosphate kinase 2 (PPK2 family)